jgi:hypothetical protein
MKSRAEPTTDEQKKRPYEPPRVEKKRSVSRVTLISGSQNVVATPTSPPPAS